MPKPEIAPGVIRLGSEWINWYAVVTDGEVTVVDSGIPGYRDQLEPALQGAGLGLGDIRAIVLTHHHNDHIGCAEWIRSKTGAPVLAPAGEAPMISGEARPGQPDGLISNLWRPVLLRFMVHAATNGGAKVDHVQAIEGFEGGDRLEVPGDPVAISTPGHSPDHHSLHFPHHGVLFTGDAMASVPWISGSTEPQLHPFGQDRAAMPASLAALEAVDASVVAFGHGEPYAGSPAEAVARARELAR